MLLPRTAGRSQPGVGGRCGTGVGNHGDVQPLTVVIGFFILHLGVINVSLTCAATVRIGKEGRDVAGMRTGDLGGKEGRKHMQEVMVRQR